MKKFEQLDKRETCVVEESILKNWKKKKILEATIKNREKNDTFVFYDGPIYANL